VCDGGVDEHEKQVVTHKQKRKRRRKRRKKDGYDEGSSH